MQEPVTSIERLKVEAVRALRLEEIVDWLARHMPPWVERIPAPPRWMGFMFWIYAAVVVHALGLVYVALTVGLK